MSSTTALHKYEIDVAKLLNSAAMVGMYRGKEVWSEVEKQMDGMQDDSLVLIDIRQANPLQYEFCQYAFGPLMESLIDRRWPRRFLVFQMHDYHKPGFFRGVLKHLGTELPRKESEKGFVSAGLYVKLMVGDEKLITFVGYLSEDQRKILDAVNVMKGATAKQVVEGSGLAEEIVVDALRFLAINYFIVAAQDKESRAIPRYYSFYSSLSKEAVQ